MDRRRLFSEINKSMAELFGIRLKKIILYGSYAKNKQTEESDMDFFVLAMKLKKIQEKIDIELQMSWPNYHWITLCSFQSQKTLWIDLWSVRKFYLSIKILRMKGSRSMENRLSDLSKYRMEKAKEYLEASELMFKNGKFSQSLNRSYYAIFHAVRVLLAIDRFD